MAKSKSGGTRSYLRGRIASDVYSIGRDSAGKKQQVVRSLAEQVKNPQTVAQMRGRMIMSTVMQAVSGLAPIIDHSFDNVPNGQPSISEFIRRNYALVKADVAAHPAENNRFGLNKYQEKGIRSGMWLISSGKALTSTYAFPGSGNNFDMTIQTKTSGLNLADLKDAVLHGHNGYITFVFILNDNTVALVRVHFSDTANQTTAITTENLEQFLEIENPQGLTITPEITGGTLSLKTNSNALCGGIIFTWADGNGGWIHSESQFGETASYEWSADVALPTYPEGTERFLNGGEL